MARAMKDSGIPWIGEIPEGWKVSRVGLHFDIILGKMLCSEPPSEEYTLEKYYCAANVHFDGISETDIKSMWFSQVEKEQYKVHQGDLLIVEGGAGAGGCAIVDSKDEDIYIQNSIMIVRPKEKECNLYLRYLIEYLVKSGYIDVVCNKATIPHFTKDKLSCVPFLLSDQGEQIASFLDAECARIDAVIEKTRASIEEYKKLKQAVITEAVTKGIRSGRKMKDSGIEWIGEIPEEWEVLRKVSYACNKSISYGIVKLFEPDDTDGIKVLRCSDVREGKIVTENIRTVTKEVSNEYGRTILNGGEVVINVRGTLGGCAVVPPEMKGYNIAREVAMVSIGNTTHNRYLMYYFLSSAFMSYENRFLAGSVYVGLNIELLSACPIPFPQYNEQEEIANYLDARSQEYDALIRAKERVVEELEKYKKSVISEYVTGKKEVIDE